MRVFGRKGQESEQQNVGVAEWGVAVTVAVVECVTGVGLRGISFPPIHPTDTTGLSRMTWILFPYGLTATRAGSETMYLVAHAGIMVLYMDQP